MSKHEKNYPRAVVREIDGQMVLDDPDALANFTAVSKNNCRNTLQLNSDRVAHFKRRVQELRKTATDVVIILLNVDDFHGSMLADFLMPGGNWQEFRDRGEIPFARGIVTRNGIQDILLTFDKEAGEKLLNMAELAVVVVDHGVAEVFIA